MSTLREARRAEVERDGRLVTATLSAELRRVLQGLAAQGDDPAHVWQLIEAIVAANRDLLRRVTHLRICRRAERATTWMDSRQLPETLVCYRHRGNYRGVFQSMAALGMVLAPYSLISQDARPEPAVLARDCHVRGELWTFELAGVVHVFTTPGSHCDRVLAAHRPPVAARSLRAVPQVVRPLEDAAAGEGDDGPA